MPGASYPRQTGFPVLTDEGCLCAGCPRVVASQLRLPAAVAKIRRRCRRLRKIRPSHRSLSTPLTRRLVPLIAVLAEVARLPAPPALASLRRVGIPRPTWRARVTPVALAARPRSITIEATLGTTPIVAARVTPIITPTARTPPTLNWVVLRIAKVGFCKHLSEDSPNFLGNSGKARQFTLDSAQV